MTSFFLQSKSLKEATYLYVYYKDLEFSKRNHHSHLFALLVFCCHDFINFFYVITLFINFMLYCFGFKSLSLFFFQKLSSKSILETCKLAGIKKNYWIFTAGTPPIFLPWAPRDFPVLADPELTSSSSSSSSSWYIVSCILHNKYKN